MAKGNIKILMLVEGAKAEPKLMKHLLNVYSIGAKHEIVSYKTNIYALYNSMCHNSDPEDWDLLLHLKERELDPAKKQIFDDKYSDILLIFDFDPQDKNFSESKITKMMSYFSNSTDMGKLYLNYPMVEAFYHMKSIPDPDYDSYMVDSLIGKLYKAQVNQIRHTNKLKKPPDLAECTSIIQQNIMKAWRIVGKQSITTPPDSADILDKQLMKMQTSSKIDVLCTCVFYIVDFNPIYAPLTLP